MNRISDGRRSHNIATNKDVYYIAPPATTSVHVSRIVVSLYVYSVVHLCIGVAYKKAFAANYLHFLNLNFVFIWQGFL